MSSVERFLTEPHTYRYDHLRIVTMTYACYGLMFLVAIALRAPFAEAVQLGTIGFVLAALMLLGGVSIQGIDFRINVVNGICAMLILFGYAFGKAPFSGIHIVLASFSGAMCAFLALIYRKG